MDNSCKLIIIIFSIIIISAQTVMALGVNSPFWKQSPYLEANLLKMYQGETREVSFQLENSIDEKDDAFALVSLIKGAEIAQITTGTEYIVPPGAKDKKVTLKISIPKTAKIGDSYDITINVKSAPKQEQGNVQLNVGYDAELPILIVEKSEAKANKQNVEPASKPVAPIKPEQTKTKKTLNTTILFTIIIFIIIAIIIFIIIMLKKRNQNV